MLKPFIAALALLAASVAIVEASSAAAPGSGGASAPASRLRLEARIRGTGRIEAKVDYREETKNGALVRKVQAEIYRAAPNTTYPVAHLGVQFATLTTDSLGNGRVEIANGGNDPNQGSFPTMKVNESVSVAGFSAVLRRKN